MFPYFDGDFLNEIWLLADEGGDVNWNTFSVRCEAHE